MWYSIYIKILSSLPLVFPYLVIVGKNSTILTQPKQKSFIAQQSSFFYGNLIAIKAHKWRKVLRNFKLQVARADFFKVKSISRFDQRLLARTLSRNMTHTW